MKTILILFILLTTTAHSQTDTEYDSVSNENFEEESIRMPSFSMEEDYLENEEELEWKQEEGNIEQEELAE